MNKDVKPVEIFTKNADEIRVMLPRLIGKHASFSNGCQIELKPQNGYFFGTTPYGQDVIFDENGNWMEAVISWIEHWNEDRTESGMPMTDCHA